MIFFSTSNILPAGGRTRHHSRRAGPKTTPQSGPRGCNCPRGSSQDRELESPGYGMSPGDSKERSPPLRPPRARSHLNVLLGEGADADARLFERAFFFLPSLLALGDNRKPDVSDCATAVERTSGGPDLLGTNRDFARRSSRLASLTRIQSLPKS